MARTRRDRPSTTARKVGLNVLALGAKPGMDAVLPPGIVDATARMLVASGTAGEGAVRFARSKAAVALYEAFDWMMPGQFEAFAYRKAFVERQVRDAVAAGATRVLALGAGYDTLGWRLAPEHPEVAFFEIDHPATSRRKAAGVAKLDARDNLHLLPEDLGARRLADVLAGQRAWDPRAAAVVVAEGLLQYLPPAAVRDLFEQCAAVTGPGSRIAFTHVATGADGRPDVGRWTGLVLWLLKAGGEPWLWSIRPDELAGFLAGAGWAHAPELVAPPARVGVEYLAVARKR